MKRGFGSVAEFDLGDVTGPNATLEPRLGARPVTSDRLVSLSVGIKPCGFAGTWTETVSFGCKKTDDSARSPKLGRN